jgi:hypothetical protein
VTEDVIPVKLEHIPHLQHALHKAHHAAGRFTDVELPPLEDFIAAHEAAQQTGQQQA